LNPTQLTVPFSVWNDDDIGLRAVDKRAHINDIHATILHLLGLEHKQTDFMHNGRMERPTILGEGKINELIS